MTVAPSGTSGRAYAPSSSVSTRRSSPSTKTRTPTTGSPATSVTVPLSTFGRSSTARSPSSGTVASAGSCPSAETDTVAPRIAVIVAAPPTTVDLVAQRAQLGDDLVQERLATPAWMHGHDEQEVDLVQPRQHRIGRRLGIDGDPGPPSGRLDLGNDRARIVVC